MTQTELVERNTVNLSAGNTAKRVFFDIVNSVKGGSGKSTISLLLAAFCDSDAYYNYKPQLKSRDSKDDKHEDNRLKRYAVAYILDLDLKGTSWEKNYGHYITTQYYYPQDDVTLHTYYTDAMDSRISSSVIKQHRTCYLQYPFLNTIMKDYKSFRNKSFWSEISIQPRSDSQSFPVRKIKLCLSSLISGEKINQIEVDIFENTLQQLIFDILNSHLMDSRSLNDTDNKVDDVHIILDMPPSYEQHAEAVVKHLLTNSNSELYQKAQNEDGPFKKNPQKNYFKQYIVNFFMPCSVSNAHIEQNGIYLWNWFQNVHYSDCVFAMIKTSRIRFRFIVNDISDYYSDIYHQFGKSLDTWTKEIIAELENGKSSLYYNKVQKILAETIDESDKRTFEGLRVMKHMKLPGAASLFHPASSIPPGSSLPIDIDYLNTIENVAADLFIEDDNDGS